MNGIVKNNAEHDFNDNSQPAVIDINVRVSDSLRAVAGDFAHSFAHLDAFPHTNILGKPRGLLHLLAMAVVKGCDPLTVRMVFENWHFQTCCELVFGTEIQGLRRILAKCPPITFSENTYKQLMVLTEDPNALKVLRFSQAITADKVETVHNMPAVLRTSGIVSKLRRPQEAMALTQIWNLIQPADDGHQKEVIRTLAKTVSREAFWDHIRNLLIDTRHPVPKGPAIQHPNFYPVTSRKMLVSVAKEFRNCLTNYIGEVIDGKMAIFVFNRDEQKAVLSVEPCFGSKGVIRELVGPENDPVANELKSEILAVLKKEGFKTGAVHRFREPPVARLSDAFDSLSKADTDYHVEKYSECLVRRIIEMK